MEWDMEVPNFEKAFQHFSETVYPRFGETRFESFRDGAANGWEGYKPKLRLRALKRLKYSDWDRSEIGSGRILQDAIEAIEIEGNDQTRNNLVSWEDRYGPGSAGHSPLMGALKQPAQRRRFDDWFWRAFKEEGASDEDLFEEFRSLAGDGYPLIAYLFFLRSIDRFAPIAPRTFDAAFARLGISLTTSGKCSWGNYSEFNEAIEGVRRLLMKKPGLANSTHIDAHSFLWMLIRMEDDRPGRAQAPGAVRYASARTKSIVEMAYNASAAAGQSGAVSMSIKKEKQIHHEQRELERIIGGLIEEQGGLCNLTGLPLQWRGSHEDAAMLASLDRVDSDGHYAVGNLQIVCRFANQWKSNTPDGEFRRLLGMVRAS